MRTYIAIIAVTALALLGLAATATAAPTNDESLAMAEAYWQGTQCAGKAVIYEDSAVAEKEKGGWVTGAWERDTTGAITGWKPDCRMALRPGMDDLQRCNAIFHEVGHWKTGWGHTPGGPMDGDVPYSHAECVAAWQAGAQAEANAALAAAPAMEEPAVEVSTPLTVKQEMEADIREALPVPRRTWDVLCRPRAGTTWLRCAARRPGARKRCYDARRGEYWEADCKLRKAKVKRAVKKIR